MPMDSWMARSSTLVLSCARKLTNQFSNRSPRRTLTTTARRPHAPLFLLPSRKPTTLLHRREPFLAKFSPSLSNEDPTSFSAPTTTSPSVASTLASHRPSPLVMPLLIPPAITHFNNASSTHQPTSTPLPATPVPAPLPLQPEPANRTTLPGSLQQQH